MRILVTRAPHQASALAGALRLRGAEPVLIPTIEIVPPDSFEVLDDALRELATFDWLVFTSANAVAVFLERRLDAPANMPRVAAIGPATARALQEGGIHVDVEPHEAVAEALAAELLPFANDGNKGPCEFLLIRAESARDVLPETLRAAGASVTVATAYKTIIPPASASALRRVFASGNQALDAITFTSASSVNNLLDLLQAEDLALPPEIVLASIGPITSAALEARGLRAHVEAKEATVDALAAAVVDFLRTRTLTATS